MRAEDILLQLLDVGALKAILSNLVRASYRDVAGSRRVGTLNSLGSLLLGGFGKRLRGSHVGL